MHPHPILLLTLATAVFGAQARRHVDTHAQGSGSLANMPNVANVDPAKINRRGLDIQADVLSTGHRPIEVTIGKSLDIDANVLQEGKTPVEVNIDGKNGYRQQETGCLVGNGIVGENGGINIGANLGLRKKRLDVNADLGSRHGPIDVVITKRLDATADVLKTKGKPLDVKITRPVDATVDVFKTEGKALVVDITKRHEDIWEGEDDELREQVKGNDVYKRLDVDATVQSPEHRPVDVTVTIGKRSGHDDDDDEDRDDKGRNLSESKDEGKKKESSDDQSPVENKKKTSGSSLPGAKNALAVVAPISLLIASLCGA
ncbi:hypothetical protein BGZ73_003492 [Actinomortierella ambigua]|nr:hypothetical protein BGZ73_003492 [Actinomortierella ambigua]